jgi:hypothetical protein
MPLGGTAKVRMTVTGHKRYKGGDETTVQRVACVGNHEEIAVSEPLPDDQVL